MKLPPSVARYKNAGLTPEATAGLQEALGCPLPTDYQQLLLETNGLSIDGGVLIYGSVELVERNQTWEVSDYTPGYLAIGDSGEGAVFLVKSDSSDPAVYVVDAGVMDIEFFSKVAESIPKWLEAGCPYKQ